MSKEQKNIVVLEHVYKEFVLSKTVTAKVLQDINVTIREGELIAIVGPSGSGKSTLMNLVGCLDMPSTGDYHFYGQQVNTLDDDALTELRSTQVSFIFQSFHLLPGKTVFQNVMLPLQYQRSFQVHTKSVLRKRSARHIFLRIIGITNQTSYQVASVNGSLLRVRWSRSQNSY